MYKIKMTDLTGTEIEKDDQKRTKHPTPHALTPEDTQKRLKRE